MKQTDAHILARINICQKANDTNKNPCCFYDHNINCCSAPKQPCDEFDNEVDRIIEAIKNPKLDTPLFER